MSTIESFELADILDRVKSWSPSLRIALARGILESLEHRSLVERPPMRLPLDQVLGMLRTETQPPTDEECTGIVDEERVRKYG
jgi:hypothetical protein